MRKILFRGKGNPRYNDGVWYEGYLTYDGEDYQIVEPEYGICKRTVLAETIGEFTGLKNKNGNNIFEGDIVRSTETGELGIVQWYEEHSAFLVWCPSPNQVGFLYECASIVEIVGNIHDNRDILKETQDD